MSNSSSTVARRSEEVAFQVLEKVLDVDIRLSDAGSGDSMPDGAWVSEVEPGCLAMVEVTAPPAADQMRDWAHDHKVGKLPSECDVLPAYVGNLDQYLQSMVGEKWVLDNVNKLASQDCVETHLYLASLTEEYGWYFNRLSDIYEDGEVEPVGNIKLPAGLTDIWFQGRVTKSEKVNIMNVRVAHFQPEAGWSRYTVSIDEQSLPAPNPGIVDDRYPVGWRQPRNR